MNRLLPGQGSGEPWVVFADIVLALLFLFVLFIFAQYIRYEELTVLEVVENRKKKVERLVKEGVPPEDSVTVRSGGPYSQQITFSSDLLFPTCGDRLRPSGREVVALVGRLLNPHASYFSSIQVEGHTDPRPPTGSEGCDFRDNWELSSRRAATVVRILNREALLDPGGISAVGRAQYQPPHATPRAVPDTAAEGHWRAYRRIEMVLRYSEKSVRDSLNNIGDDRRLQSEGHDG